MFGYSEFALQNRGSLPWGYPPATVNGVPVRVELTNGTTVGGLTAQRYPWRLVPHVGRIWPILHQHEHVPADDYTKGLAPSFGLNTVFLGGHDSPIFQGFVGDKPNINKHVAFKVSEIRRPSEQIVFAESQLMNAGGLTPGGIERPGSHFVCPPRASVQMWRVNLADEFEILTGQIIGLPKGRYGNRTVVSFLDGHAAALAPRELDDMRLWAPRATTPNYQF